MSAEESLGKTLLAEVEEVGLEEIFNELRRKDNVDIDWFGLPVLERLWASILEARKVTTKTQLTLPIVELLSLRSGGGKTHLLYHLTALAVLPVFLGGRQKVTIILDTDGRFSIRRLAQQMKTIAASRFEPEEGRQSLEDTIISALQHVHIFHPQSLSSTVATLQSLQGYLFDASRHHSFDRAIGFVALDSVSAFYWQNRAETEHTALIASTSGTKSAPKPSDYVQLASTLKSCSSAFNAPIIFTSTHLGPMKTSIPFGVDVRAVRPSLPPPWQGLPNLRLLIQRIPVRKLPREIDIEEALRESEMRSKAVEQGRFECSINEWGLDERTLNMLHRGETSFRMTITGTGIGIHDISHASANDGISTAAGRD